MRRLIDSDRRLFKSIIQCQTRVLRQLFIDKPTSTRSLRVRAHNFIQPPKDNRNFVSWVFYEALCPLRTARSRASLCLFAKRLFQRLTTFTYFVYGIFYALVNPCAFVSKVV